MATFLFALINIIVLIIVFILSRMGAISWELVLTKKHGGDLENFMVVLALFFSAAYAGSMAYSFDDLNLSKNLLHLFGTFLFFICMNIAVLISSSILIVYLVSSFRKKSNIMLGIFLLINFSLFIYEIVSFDTAYYSKSPEIKSLNGKL